MAKIHNGGMIVSLINDVVKLDVSKQKNEIGPSSYTIHKINSICIKDFKIICETIKFQEENIEKEFLTTGLAMIFWIWHQKHRQQKPKVDRTTSN